MQHDMCKYVQEGVRLKEFTEDNNLFFFKKELLSTSIFIFF